MVFGVIPLDEDEGLLYVSSPHDIHTLFIGAPAEQEEARYYPALQTWALAQEIEQVEPIPAAATETTEEARARRALGLLMDCPIPDILVRTLRFLYSYD